MTPYEYKLLCLIRREKEIDWTDALNLIKAKSPRLDYNAWDAIMKDLLEFRYLDFKPPTKKPPDGRASLSPFGLRAIERYRYERKRYAVTLIASALFALLSGLSSALFTIWLTR